MDTKIETIDCACVIHGDAYSWDYVEKLFNMLNRHITRPINLHVYTEATRNVPSPMIKHSLTEFSIAVSSQAWWYKMQLFNTEHHAGPLLYFDLDTVIVNNIDWIWQQPPEYFRAPRDFKYLWQPRHTGINSSVMWWDTVKYSYVWESFSQQDFNKITLKYRGDQDYISDQILENDRRFLDPIRIQSWRWQCLDGGYNFTKKRHFTPGTGTKIDHLTSVLIFHGTPKPNEISDEIILKHWR